MIKSYEAIYDNGRLEWLKASPRLSRARVLVIVDEDDTASVDTPNGPQVAAVLEQLAARNAARAFGDPLAWQRAERAERELPGRD